MRTLAPCLVLLIVGSVASASAQTTAANLAKYDALRTRLRGSLVIEEDVPGGGMPAHIRHDGMGYIRWADATIDLGWYLGVLATEHRMLATPGRFPGLAAVRDAGGTADELYFALAALERLDRVGNTVFEAPCTMNEALDGFFIRDDVPADFHTRFGLSSTRSDFLDTLVTQKEMSQDQVWHLMMGLALVSELVDEGTTVRGQNLSTWALQQLERVLTHVADGWIITNPACMDRNVDRGPVATGYAFGANEAASFLTDGRLNFEVSRLEVGLWDTLGDPDNPAYDNVDNLHMAMVVAAVGGGFGRETIEVLAELAENEGWWAYPLLHVVLHGEDGAPTWCEHRDRVNSEARRQLDELPSGDEPASPRPGRAEHGFTTSNRFIRGLDRAYAGSDGSEGERYNGLDFMLLHNLLAMATPSEWEGSDAPPLGPCDPPPPPADAGPSRSDAGVSVDAGTGSDGTGCGCRAAGQGGSAPTALLIAMAGLLLQRRLRR